MKQLEISRYRSILRYAIRKRSKDLWNTILKKTLQMKNMQKLSSILNTEKVL